MATVELVGDVATAELAKKSADKFKTAQMVACSDDSVAELEALFDSRPSVSMESVMATKYASTYTTLTAIPADVFDTSMRCAVTSYRDAFSGCAALTMAQFQGAVNGTNYPIYHRSFLDTRDATDLSGMFKGCAGMVGAMPWAISCKSITSIEALRDIFTGSGITTARFEDVPSDVVPMITPAVVGSQLTRIIINGLYTGETA